MKPQAIWIDLDNSPHVPLFVPIIRHYRETGIEVTITARDHAQTIELLTLNQLDDTYHVVGHHHGGRRINKVLGTLLRARQLSTYIKERSKQCRITVAVSHGSRALVLAARWLGIPTLTMYDYEYTETAIFNRLSTIVLVPDRIPDEVLNEIGLLPDKRMRYPGLKEELYLRRFQPQPGFRDNFLRSHDRGVDKPAIMAVVRPPATTANYHSSQSEALLDDLLLFLINSHHVFTVIVPRTGQQSTEIRQKILRLPDGNERTLVLESAIDGLQLGFAADLLISGGGTMNREAALLGVPVYSIFAGRQGALDRQMEEEGLITFIRDARDLAKIRLERRSHDPVNVLTDRVEKFVIKQIDSFLTADLQP